MNQTTNKNPKKKKPKKDPYLRIKYIAYCLSQLPFETYEFDDLVRFAKFQLAHKCNRLLKDPIWDDYTSEEILVEFFAHQFETNDKFLTEFKLALGGVTDVDEFDSWANAQMGEEDKIKTEGLVDRIKFDPSKDVLGDE